MRLKVRELDLGAGRPVAFLNEATSHALNVHAGDRVAIANSNKMIIAVVDILKNFLDKNEISLSEEVTSFLHLKPGEYVDVTLTLIPQSTQYIIKKLKGEVLTKGEIYAIIKDIVNNSLFEAEIAYFISGVYKYGMTFQELIYLTEAMYKTGIHLVWNSKNIVDKHSIGGVAGNRTTPIVISICAALGIVMPKTSSRAITSAAGTADVIETITNVDLSPKQMKDVVNKTGACLAWGGSLGLAPADDKLIRVERLLNLDPESQLIASIISKKLATGSTHVLIDIPYGRGAKVSIRESLKLKNKFLNIGKHFNLKIKVILTDGSQPIGNGIGPVLEMLDILAVLKREKDAPRDLEKKSIVLAGIILEMMKKAKKNEGMSMAREILDSGKALKKFNEIITEQGRKKRLLRTGGFKHIIRAKRSGKIKAINNEKINYLARLLGCPQDKSSGIYLYKHKNENFKVNEPILTLYAESRKKLRKAIEYFREAKIILTSSPRSSYPES